MKQSTCSFLRKQVKECLYSGPFVRESDYVIAPTMNLRNPKIILHDCQSLDPQLVQDNPRIAQIYC